MDKVATNPLSERNVTPKVYSVQCQGKAVGCKGLFESPSHSARTCSPACRQKKHRDEKRILRERFGEIMRELIRLSSQLEGAEKILRDKGLMEVADTIASAVSKMGELDA
jgi:hypothetical protein